MAVIKRKTVISVDSEWRGPFEETYNGKVSKFWEALATVADGQHGAEKNVLRVFSLRIANEIAPDATYAMMCIGKSENGIWKQKITQSDNPSLQRDEDAAPYSPPEPSSNGSSPSFDEMVALYGECAGASRKTWGEVSDEALVAGAATLFIQSCMKGIKPPAKPGYQNKAMQDHLAESEEVVKDEIVVEEATGDLPF